MANLKITLVKSTNNSLKKHCATVAALGLHKIGQSVIKNDDPAIRGMVHTVAHLVTCEEV
ncbi:MAG TPA: 50S ribosomal protein L30 [Bacillota bacterium]|nr:50S ribosomal protein L30 [Bacillota bacterium]HPE37880.1 50S ribosomal protein L30 [Bacillota bacterium]